MITRKKKKKRTFLRINFIISTLERFGLKVASEVIFMQVGHALER